MKKQKLISVLLTASMVAGISLTGCGNKAENTADTTAAKEAAGASADTKADNGETVTVTLGYWGDSGETEAYEKSLEGIEAAIPGVKVELAHYAGTADFWDSLPGQIAAGTAPDIIVPSNEGHLGYITEGLFLPLNDYGFDLSGFDENAVEAWTWEGKLYAIPATAAPGLFIINKDMWDEAGLGEMPKTWDEVYEAAKVLTKDDVAGLCIDFSQGYHPTQYMNSFGGGWKNGDEINSKANVDAFDYIFKMYEEGLAVNPKDVGLSWDGEVFAGGKCAMITGGTWYIGMMKEAAPDINYEVVPMPGGNGNHGCTLHSQGFAVLSSSKNPEKAAQAAYYLCNENAQRLTAEIVGNMPSLLSLRDWYFEENPKIAPAKESLEWATSFGYPANAQEFQTDLVRAFEEVEYAGKEADSKGILDNLAAKYGNQ